MDTKKKHDVELVNCEAKFHKQLKYLQKTHDE